MLNFFGKNTLPFLISSFIVIAGLVACAVIVQLQNIKKSKVDSLLEVFKDVDIDSFVVANNSDIVKVYSDIFKSYANAMADI